MGKKLVNQEGHFVKYITELLGVQQLCLDSWVLLNFFPMGQHFTAETNPWGRKNKVSHLSASHCV